MADGKKKVKVRNFRTAAELYGKQVSLGTDTFGRLGTPVLHDKDTNGKPVEIPMDTGTVGSFFEMFAYTVGAAIVSFSRKHMGYLRTLVLNADDKMLQDGRKLHIPVEDSKRFPLPGIVVSVKDAIALATLWEKILTESAKTYPPDEAEVVTKARKEETEEIQVSLY